ncbi:MAG: PhoH family protein [Bacteroidales bacterium]
MTEKRIKLLEIDPREIYGANDKILKRVKDYFPKLVVAARDSDIYMRGEEEDITKFEKCINELIKLRNHKRNLNEDDVDRILDYRSIPTSVSSNNTEEINEAAYIIVHGNAGRTIRARTPNQRKMVDLYSKTDLLFAIGPAGTGKTYTAIALAVRALRNREVKKIILTRPAVEAGERLGFLPGDLKEKLDPYLQPLYDALEDMINPKKLKNLIEDGTIQIAPLAYMRGRTLDSAIVILDEAQNTSLSQLKMFLTRMGNNAKFIVTGDETQIDLPNIKESGLKRCVELLKDIKEISIVRMGNEDIVRHPLVTKIIKAFS